MNDAVQGVEVSSQISMRIPREALEAIMEFDEEIRKSKNLALLTPHARILFWLCMNGSGSVNDALIVSKVSYASFFSVLKRLKSEQMIAAEKDDVDSRVRKLSLIV